MVSVMLRSQRKAKRAAEAGQRQAQAEAAEKATKSREDLLEFVRQRREEKRKSCLEIEQAPPCDDEDRYRIRPRSPELFRTKSPLPVSRDKTVFDFLGVILNLFYNFLFLNYATHPLRI